MGSCDQLAQKWPPAFLHALTELVGVTVVVFVKVAPRVMIFVLVVNDKDTLVFVGVGKVSVLVDRPEYMVAGGSVLVTVVDERTSSVVVLAGARIVVVVFTGLPVTVTTGTSGPRRSNG